MPPQKAFIIAGVKVVIAMRWDAKPLSPERGALWLVYPRGTDPALEGTAWKDSAVRNIEQIFVR